jgi:hypothetical protein
MNDGNNQSLLKAKLYENELKENKRSVEALIALLEWEGINHPQYNQLEYLKKRNQEIDDQLNSLSQIISNLESKN